VESAVSRERSGSEIVFGMLKILMIGYQMWGPTSALELGQLSKFLRTSENALGDVLVYLAGEELIALDATAGTVRLSDHGARNLLSALREEMR